MYIYKIKIKKKKPQNLGLGDEHARASTDFAKLAFSGIIISYG